MLFLSSAYARSTAVRFGIVVGDNATSPAALRLGGCCGPHAAAAANISKRVNFMPLSGSSVDDDASSDAPAKVQWACTRARCPRGTAFRTTRRLPDASIFQSWH